MNRRALNASFLLSCVGVCVLSCVVVVFPRSCRRSHGPRPQVTCTRPLRSRPSPSVSTLSASSSTKTISSIFLDTAPLRSRLQSSLRHRRPYRYAVSLVAISRPVVCISDLLKFATLVAHRSTYSTTPSAHTALEPFSGDTIGGRD